MFHCHVFLLFTFVVLSKNEIETSRIRFPLFFFLVVCVFLCKQVNERGMFVTSSQTDALSVSSSEYVCVCVGVCVCSWQSSEGIGCFVMTLQAGSGTSRLKMTCCVYFSVSAIEMQTEIIVGNSCKGSICMYSLTLLCMLL